MKSTPRQPKSTLPPLLHLTYVLQHSADELLQKEVGVSLGHARLLSGLSASTARSQHQLASELQQTEANVSRQLQIMKKQGLVSIAKNKKDSRRRDVCLTAKGNKVCQSAENLLKKQQKKFLSALGANEAQLLDQAARKLA